MRNYQAIKGWLPLICMLLFSQINCAAELRSIKMVNTNKIKTIFLQITGKYQYRTYALHNPERLVVDLEQTSLQPRLTSLQMQNDLISRVRHGRPLRNTLRIVFDVKYPVTPSAVQMPGEYPQQSVLKIEVHRDLDRPEPNQVYISTPKRPLRDVVVIIDPGHGGKDPGAIGARKSREKDIVLAISKKLKKLIDKQPGMRAILTRNGDYYVGLRERMDIARKHDGDIFVAIHADAFGNHKSHGASVFALSARGATSEAARWLAEKDNYSELGGVDLSSLDDKNDEIRSVLIDLSQTATISASLNMGRNVLFNLDKITSLHSKKVEQARFVVLKSPDIPSVLVETGFISNPREERNLTSSRYQARVSQAIFQGIKTYFWNYPPYGSLIEAMSMRDRKIVKNTPTKRAA